MALDGITMKALTEEFQETILAGKIQKINQINNDLLIINIYKNKNYKLLISINSSHPRIHFTDENFNNPSSPPNFCMVLRKHLINSRISKIEQHKMDRTLIFTINGRNEIGIEKEYKMVIDIMGKHSNLVLLNDKNQVIESLKRVSHDMSRIRAVYPGSDYHLLEQNKFNILEKQVFLKDLDIKPRLHIFRIFYTYFTGFSPLTGMEISYLAGLDPRNYYENLSEDEKSSLENAFQEFVKKIINKDYTFTVYKEGKKISDFHALYLNHISLYDKEFNSMSQAMDFYYLSSLVDDSLGQSKNNIKKQIELLLEKEYKKLDIMQTDLLKSQDFEKFRVEGDILASNVHLIKKGMSSIELYNYYSDKYITIPLDPTISPWENTEKKYKKSKKMSRAIKILSKNIPIIDNEIHYLESVLDSLTRVSNHEELNEIKDELIKEKYLKIKSKRNRYKQVKKSRALHYKTKSNLDIYVGKNNRQNEEITIRKSNKTDIFFHAKDIPGAHVILKNNFESLDDIKEEDILSAAYLAGINSKNKFDNSVEVDYTFIKNVRKEKGAKLGMVYYTDFKTILVDISQKNNNLKKID